MGSRTQEYSVTCPCCGQDVRITRPVLVDFERMSASFDGAGIVPLWTQPLMVLDVLARRFGTPVSKEILISHLWTLNEPENAAVCLRVLVANLRRRLPHEYCIKTLRTRGYQLLRKNKRDVRLKCDYAASKTQSNIRQTNH